MIGFLIVLGAVLFLVWRSRRRRRQALLAGLDGSRPSFMVEPPRRLLSVRSSETLR